LALKNLKLKTGMTQSYIITLLACNLSAEDILNIGLKSLKVEESQQDF
jgi:hypothetical protein